MQGIVTDEKGGYVKAAIIKLIKKKDLTDEIEEGAVTYAETDEEGRFVIQELNPDEKYIIEIHVESPEPAEKEPETVAEEPAAQEFFDNILDEELDEETADLDDETFLVKETRIVDSLATDRRDRVTSSSNMAAANCLYNMTGLKEKTHMKKNNLW